MPSSARLYDAPVGHTVTQAACSQCRQDLGKVDGAAGLTLAHLVAVHPVQPGAARFGTVGVLIGQRRRVAAGVPFLAADHACLAADAGVEIDHQAKATGRRGRGQAGHRRARNSRPYLEITGRAGRPAGGRSGVNCGPGVGRRRALDAHAQIVPGRLTGHRVGIGVAIAALAFG
jgi:hypothetical protein